MFVIVKISGNNKSFIPLCYFEDENQAKAMFESISKTSKNRLLLVDSFSNNIKYEDSFNIISSYRPPSKLNSSNMYDSRTEIMRNTENQKRLKREELENKHKHLLSLSIEELEGEKLPIDYYIKKTKKKETNIFYFHYDLLEENSNLIFVSKVPWTLEFDPLKIRISKQSIYEDKYLSIFCYAKTNSEAEKLIKPEIKKYFKNLKKKKI